MINFLKTRRENSDEKKFLNLFNYFLIKRDFLSIMTLLRSGSGDFNIPLLREKLKGMFLTNPLCKDMLFIGADITSVMSHMTFAGSVDIKTDKAKANKLIDKLYYDGQFLDTIKQDYSNLDFDASAIQAKLGDPENIALLRDVLAKLG